MNPEEIDALMTRLNGTVTEADIALAGDTLLQNASRHSKSVAFALCGIFFDYPARRLVNDAAKDEGASVMLKPSWPSMTTPPCRIVSSR